MNKIKLSKEEKDLLDSFEHGEWQSKVRPSSKKVDDVFGILHHLVHNAISVEDMNAAITQKMNLSIRDKR